MNSDIVESARIGEMLDIIDSDKGGVWHIYQKEIDDNRVVLTFCKYIQGLSTIQAQAIIGWLEWEDNKRSFEKLAYISEL